VLFEIVYCDCDLVSIEVSPGKAVEGEGIVAILRPRLHPLQVIDCDGKIAGVIRESGELHVRAHRPARVGIAASDEIVVGFSLFFPAELFVGLCPIVIDAGKSGKVRKIGDKHRGGIDEVLKARLISDQIGGPRLQLCLLVRQTELEIGAGLFGFE
jgi:hypothetical protein